MKTLVDILGVFAVLGFPSLFGLFTLMYRKIKANDKKTEAVQLGVQALLRSNLYSMYNKYIELGYAPLYARENFDNMYKHYHILGANGVMDEIRDKFQALPTEPPKEV
jgi:hypothetical protein